MHFLRRKRTNTMSKTLFLFSSFLVDTATNLVVEILYGQTSRLGLTNINDTYYRTTVVKGEEKWKNGKQKGENVGRKRWAMIPSAMNVIGTKCFFASMALALLLSLLSILVYTLCISIRYITYVNSVYNGGICYSIFSAALKGLEVEILGLGALENPPIARLLEQKNASKMSSKVYAVYWYLHQSADTNNKTFADDDIIVFFDGADTLHINHHNHNSTTERLMDSFSKLEQPHSIIFSAERNCHPRHPSTICNELYARKWEVMSNQSSFRFVNSGGWIARYHVAIRFLDLWIELMEQQHGKRDDQLAIHDYILRKEKNVSYGDINIILDRNCTIFQTSHLTAFSMGDWYAPEYDVKGPFMRVDGVVYNSETDTFPLLLHFNGIKFFMSQVSNMHSQISSQFLSYLTTPTPCQMSR